MIKTVTEDHLKEADMKEFTLDGTRVKSGDEIKWLQQLKRKFKAQQAPLKKKRLYIGDPQESD